MYEREAISANTDSYPSPSPFFRTMTAAKALNFACIHGTVSCWSQESPSDDMRSQGGNLHSDYAITLAALIKNNKIDVDRKFAVTVRPNRDR